MRSTRGMRGAIKIGCILWLALLGVFAHMAYVIIPVKVKTSTFYDFMEEEAAFCAVRMTPVIASERVMMSEKVSRPSRLWRMRCNSPLSAEVLSALRSET